MLFLVGMRPCEAAKPNTTAATAAKNQAERSASTPRSVAGPAIRWASSTKQAAPIKAAHAVRTASRDGRERPSAKTSNAVNKQVDAQVKPGLVRAAIGPASSSKRRVADT